MMGRAFESMKFVSLFAATLCMLACDDGGRDEDETPDAGGEYGTGPCEMLEYHEGTDGSLFVSDEYLYEYNEKYLLTEIEIYHNTSDSTTNYLYYYNAEDLLERWEIIGVGGSITQSEDYFYDEQDRIIETTYNDFGEGEPCTSRYYYYASSGMLDYEEVADPDTPDAEHGITKYYYNEQDLLIQKDEYEKGTPEVIENRWTYEYDSGGLLVEERKFTGADTLTHILTYEYNAKDLAVKLEGDSTDFTGEGAPDGVIDSYEMLTYDGEDRLLVDTWYSCDGYDCENGDTSINKREEYSYDCWEE